LKAFGASEMNLVRGKEEEPNYRNHLYHSEPNDKGGGRINLNGIFTKE
jgi:hypothetical protein